MATFGFENPTIHGVAQITATATPGWMTLTLRSRQGEEVEIAMRMEERDPKLARYVRALVEQINLVAGAYDLLSDDQMDELEVSREAAGALLVQRIAALGGASSRNLAVAPRPFGQE